jgi:hypothetical protein
VITHRETDLRFKLTRDVEMAEDKFTMTRYTNSHSRYLKFHVPVDKFVAHVQEKVESLDSKLLVFPGDIEGTNYVHIQRAKDPI